MSLQDKVSGRAKKAILSIVVLVAIGLVVAIGAYFLFGNASSSDSKAPASINETQNTPSVVAPKEIRASWLFTGNSFWGRYTNDAAMKTENPYKFPFARLNEFKRQDYDAWITGLECPTTKKGVSMSSADMEATLTFNCNPAYLGEFAKWFDVVSLANNHTDNMGADGFTETQTALTKHDLQYFGHYNPEQRDELCEVVSLPVRTRMNDGTTKQRKLPIALCGYHFVFALPTAESLTKIADYAKYFPTIVLPHGGAEYEAIPDNIKTDLYHTMIDNGADMVLGDHPHWIQTTEAYQGKLIVYSMGNFMFDQQGSSELTRSAAIRVDATISAQDDDALARWLEVADDCEKYQDDCLSLARGESLQKLQLDYSFEAIATSDVGYQTHPASELQSSVEQRLRWPETMRALGQ